MGNILMSALGILHDAQESFFMIEFSIACPMNKLIVGIFSFKTI
jgi:hypothetical protein